MRVTVAKWAQNFRGLTWFADSRSVYLDVAQISYMSSFILRATMGQLIGVKVRSGTEGYLVVQYLYTIEMF